MESAEPRARKRTNPVFTRQLESIELVAQKSAQGTIKPNTARTHLKHIFSKTETNRQSELVTLILNGPGRMREFAAEPAAATIRIRGSAPTSYFFLFTSTFLGYPPPP